MTFWFLLLLGLATYLIVQRSVAHITRTPVWLLWLVLMTPALILNGWTLMYGTQQPPPPAVVIWPSIICLLLYWLLFQWGRRTPRDTQTEPQAIESQSAIHPTAEPVPVRPIEPTEETQLRNCFPWSVYYIHNIEYRPQAVICRGQIRTTPTQAYQQIKANIEAEFGDRFLLIFQEGFNGKPFFVLVPNTQAAKNNSSKPERITRPALALFLVLATLATTTWVGATNAGADPKQVASDLSMLLKGLPYALGLMTILGIHELGHYLTARYYKIRATLPYFIPLPYFLGTFGAFIQMRSPIPHRKALFDVSIAGPLAGFVVTLPLLIWGLVNSELVPMTDQTGLLKPEALNPKSSILLALLSKLALGSELTSTSAINLHPIAIAGFLGLIVTALNLMPVGQLDGGHIVHAMFGQKTAIVIGQISRLLLLLLSLVQQEFLIWAIILLFIPLIDEPALNDVTELDNKRDILGLMAMALLIIIVLPLPQAIANLLQI
ncbi:MULTISPECIES: site-2 protease family protein [unclassified Nodularia (in: cyanobacteria)]|uniref:site-2 protease family protein n=1 Tax=unclassified Nodularia (in: cyanobacteria) TaxID=2656917 RepID=UPI00187F5851|nr:MULTISPECIES: site-2 protease family protein [unclassified Nodularia (in: cyanobacteria)]MBE9201356.1 site-2 protease family protein [Nodularia sp. LEGE 06071]MCC2694658.1 site-2 protease family protein [Nodularia sp. LEGE 04288]